MSITLFLLVKTSSSGHWAAKLIATIPKTNIKRKGHISYQPPPQVYRLKLCYPKKLVHM